MAVVEWWDNFSKLRPVNIPRSSVEIFKRCLWTVKALRICTQWVDLLVVVPAGTSMPMDISNHVGFVELKRAYLDMEGQPLSFFPISISREVTHIPLTDAAPERQEYNLKNLIPIGIFPENIGSNSGLAIHMIRFQEFFNDEFKRDFVRVITCDIDIYTRILKVLFLFAQIILIFFFL